MSDRLLPVAYNLTFGVITSESSQNYLNIVIESILDLKIDNFEILIVGGQPNSISPHVRWLKFDENEKNNWITKKKNIIAKEARYEFIVMIHDYLVFDRNWFYEFSKNKIRVNDVIVTRIFNYDGSRFRDWVIWAENNWIFDKTIQHFQYGLLPYWVKFLKRRMYISGGFWVASKEFMQSFPLDESLAWGEAEDVEWSKRVREIANFRIFTKAHIHLLKNKDVILKKIPLRILCDMLMYEIFRIKPRKRYEI